MEKLISKLISIKPTIFATVGVLGGGFIGLLGGWDIALETLTVFMSIDYLMGLFIAGHLKKSRKTESGRLSSIVGWRGLMKKGGTLAIVMIAARLDLLFKVDFLRYTAILGFISNELVSITENAGLAGIYIPPAIEKAMDMLQTKEEEI